MSLLAGLTIGLFREARDGRRVFGVGPAGSEAWYLFRPGNAGDRASP